MMGTCWNFAIQSSYQLNLRIDVKCHSGSSTSTDVRCLRTFNSADNDKVPKRESNQ